MDKRIIIILLAGFIQAQEFDPVCSKSLLTRKFLEKAVTVTSNQELFDVTFYDLYLNVVPDEKTISGYNRVHGLIDENATEVTHLEFDFMKPMQVDSISSGKGSLGFSHSDDILSVTLPDTLEQGDTFEVIIYFTGTPFVDPGATWNAFNFHSYDGKPMIWTLSEPFGARTWWPCKDNPMDKADSMFITVRVPIESDTLLVASNGILVRTESDQNHRTYYWETRYPMATYLASVGIHPYTVWKEWLYFSQTDSMPIEYYVFPSWESTAKEKYSRTPDMLTVFSDLFGLYPFWEEKYGHYMFMFGGGMEHQTMTGLGTFNESIIAHEAAHQWWGDLITCADFSNIWLNEGFARYSEALWWEEAYGVEARQNFMEYIEYYGEGTVYVPEHSSVSRIFNGNLTYNKAGWVLHMLRYVVGDSVFFEILKRYADDPDFRFGTANTEQFSNFCERISGKDLSRFFDQWIYNEYYPEYTYSWAQSEDTLKYMIVQTTKGGVLFDMPVDITVVTGQDTVDHRVRVHEDTLKGNIFLPDQDPVTDVVLDSNNWVLNKATRTDYLDTNSSVPDLFSIGVPYPNPFNPSMRLDYVLKKELPVTFDIYNLKGEQVYSTIRRGKPGDNRFTWDGRSSAGRLLSSGLYLIRLSHENNRHFRKVLFIK